MKTLLSALLSVRGRITTAVTLLFAAVMLFGAWFLLDRAESAWIDDLRARDLAELEMLARDLQTFDVQAGDFSLPVGSDGTVYSLTDGSGNLVAPTPGDNFGAGVIEITEPSGSFTIESFVPTEGSFDQTTPSYLVFDDDPVTTVSFPVELESGSLILVASSSLVSVRSGVDALGDILVVLIPILVAGVGAMTWIVTGRSFHPVAAITNQVERITDDRLDERVPVPRSRDEVAHLARTMNTMLDRLSSSRRRQREFVSDASHELRSPVAASKAKLEVALTVDEPDWEETARTVIDEQDRLGAMVDDLLLLATVDEMQSVVPAEVDLDDLVFAEAARLPSSGIDVGGVKAVRMHGDSMQLTRLIRNLIDNAVRWSRTTVSVALDVDESEAVLRVDDDGPGIPEADRQRVFERFVRLEEARTRDNGGSGLGLALVYAIAAAHKGTVVVENAPIGGARFEVRLPA